MRHTKSRTTAIRLNHLSQIFGVIYDLPLQVSSLWTPYIDEIKEGLPRISTQFRNTPMRFSLGLHALMWWGRISMSRVGCPADLRSKRNTLGSAHRLLRGFGGTRLHATKETEQTQPNKPVFRQRPLGSRNRLS